MRRFWHSDQVVVEYVPLPDEDYRCDVEGKMVKSHRKGQRQKTKQT